MVKTGFAVYPLPLPPAGMVSDATVPGLAPPANVAVADGVPPTGVAPERETVGGMVRLQDMTGRRFQNRDTTKTLLTKVIFRHYLHVDKVTTEGHHNCAATVEGVGYQ